MSIAFVVLVSRGIKVNRVDVVASDDCGLKDAVSILLSGIKVKRDDVERMVVVSISGLTPKVFEAFSELDANFSPFS